MPAKEAGFANGWLIEGILKEGVDRHAWCGHTPASERSSVAAIG
jgi:hypothetical protein